MQLLAHLLQVCISILVSTVTSGHVLFAANVDDFHSLTKQFIPNLADQLAGLVPRAKNTNHKPVKHFIPVPKPEETDQDSMYKPSQESEEYVNMNSKPAYFKPNEHSMRIMNNKSSEESSAIYFPEYADAPQKNEESKQYEDRDANGSVETEVVEKSESEIEEAEREVVSRNPRTSVIKGREELQQNEQGRSRFARKKKVRTVQVNMEQLVEKVKDRIMRDLRPEINKGLQNTRIKANAKKTRLVKRPTGHAIRQKVEEITGKLLASEKVKNNDRYEKDPELVSRPKLKQKIHVNGKVNNQRPRKPIQSQGKDDKEVIEEDDILTKVKLSSSKKKDSYEDYVVPKKEIDLFESSESETLTTLKEFRFKQRTQKNNTLKTERLMAVTNKETLKRTTPEYEEYEEKTTEAELKARTENIGDYDDIQTDNTKITSQDTNNKFNTKDVTVEAKGKGKKSKLGTMIPTRVTYKMTSPDYYGKLPKIAERYKFDEPIPFKDMEDENLKPVGNPAANINGKVKV